MYSRAGASKPSKILEQYQKIECLADNPKMKGKDPYNRYERYKSATTVKEFYEKGGTPADLSLRYDIKQGFVKVIQSRHGPGIVTTHRNQLGSLRSSLLLVVVSKVESAFQVQTANRG